MKERIKKIQELLEKDEALLITDDNNRFYFTGFRSSAGTVLITKEKAELLIDFRYYEKAAKTVISTGVLLCEKLFAQLSELLKKEGVKKVYLETDSISISRYNLFKNALSDFEIMTDEKFSKKISELRSIKSAEEIKNIETAQKITDDTFSYILNRIKSGISEREIMLDMEFFSRKNGSEEVAFDFIVVSGKNSSLPHGVPTDKKIESGDFITMDFGCTVNGYRSDMTRTVAFGNITEKQKQVYDVVLKAQLAALEKIGPDVPCDEVDAAARDIITDAGFGKNFGHGLGHSVGLEIHENPACNTRDKTPLKGGMIMTVEPGIYLENEFGVRIEDMVVVTQNGYINLTKSKKELIQI